MSGRGDGITCLQKLHGGSLANCSDQDVTTTLTEGECDGQSTDDSASWQANKKTDEAVEPATAPSGGYLWRFSTGVLSTTTGAITGAVGLGVGGVKWVAGKGYTAGAVVVDTTKSVVSKVPVPSLKSKPKKE